MIYNFFPFNFLAAVVFHFLETKGCTAKQSQPRYGPEPVFLSPMADLSLLLPIVLLLTDLSLLLQGVRSDPATLV